MVIGIPSSRIKIFKCAIILFRYTLQTDALKASAAITSRHGENNSRGFALFVWL